MLLFRETERDQRKTSYRRERRRDLIYGRSPPPAGDGVELDLEVTKHGGVASALTQRKRVRLGRSMATGGSAGLAEEAPDGRNGRAQASGCSGTAACLVALQLMMDASAQD